MKRAVLFIVIFFILSTISFSVFAYVPYRNYTFSKDDKMAEEEPQAYLPSAVITGRSLGTANFVDPEDIHVASNGKVYICDAGNNRILVLDNNLKLEQIIDRFNNGGTEDSFKNPSGVFVADNSNIYIADTDNARVVILKQDGSMVAVYGRPQSNLITNKDFNYKPIKIVVDFAYRMFIVSQNENNGMIELQKDGSFTGYFGAVKTVAKLTDLFSFTQEQKDRKTKNTPVEYSNVNVDKSGFVYGTVSSYNVNGSVNEDVFVQKKNPTGNDVLKRNGFFSIMGDINYIYENSSPILPQLCDIALRESGVYSVLGKRTGRIYTYDDNGNLMYIFGGIGTNFGQFSLPVALDVLDNSKYLVVDRNLNQIILFEPTRYGNLVTGAAQDYYNMDYEKAEEKYSEILKFSVKSDTAYDGMAKALLRKGDYTQAMKYFKLSGNRNGYSEAYKTYRAEWIDRNFMGIVSTVIAVLLLFFVIRFIVRRKRRMFHA